MKKKKKENLLKSAFVTRTQGFIDIDQKRDFWKEFASEHNGTFKIKQTVAKDLQKFAMSVPYKKYTIEFTESDTHPLKINCKLPANQNFNFLVTYKDTFDKILNFFGKKDIKTNDENFDKKYVIQGNKADFIKKIFSNDKIRTVLLVNNVFSFNCAFEKKNSSIQLISVVSRTVNSKNELSELYELFCLIIDEMEKLEIIKD